MKFEEALALAEEATDELSHFVGENSLQAILKSRYLRGSQYDVAKMNFKGSKTFNDIDKNPKELCLVRKGLADKPEQLSGNSGSTRFLLDMENIKNIRNIKKPYPVAELPVQNQKFIDTVMKRLYDEGLDPIKYNKLKSIVYHKPMLEPEELKKQIDDLFKNSRGSFADDARSIYSDYKIVYDKMRRREGEERLDLSKAVIPLNSKYVKIVLNKKDINEKIKRMVRVKYEKDPNLFYNNETLRDLLK